MKPDKHNITIQAGKSRMRGPVKTAAAVMILSFILFTFIAEEDYFLNLDKTNPLLNAFLIFIIFIAVCTGIYCSGLAFFSFISGWRRLSILSPAPETVQPGTVLFSSQSLKMGLMDYVMGVNIRFTDTGLIFFQSRPFTFMHRPFIISYEKITDIKITDSSGQYAEFTAEGIKISISGDSAEALKKKKQDPSLPIISLKPGDDDAESSMKRGEERRSTRRCRFDELQPVFISAVRGFMKSKKPAELESKIRNCYETTYMKKGFFGVFIYHQYTGMVITPDWFFWGISDGEDIFAGCIKMKDIAKIPDYEKILMSNPIEMRGIDISGFHYNESQHGSWSLYTGNDKAGEDFRQELAEAVRKYSIQH